MPSPTADILLSLYDKENFPRFALLFEKAGETSPFRFLVPRPEEARNAVILENRSAKEVIALRYRWLVSDATGDRTHTHTSDSYLVDVYRPVAVPGSRYLVTRSGMLDESVLDRILAGNGFLGSGSRAQPLSDDVVELTFQIDLIVFADGEISGPDPDEYAAELQVRKTAAEFIAKRIRQAQAEHRDVALALREFTVIPTNHRDPLARMLRESAQTYIKRSHPTIGDLDRSETTLRFLENRPELPKFYRRRWNKREQLRLTSSASSNSASFHPSSTLHQPAAPAR